MSSADAIVSEISNDPRVEVLLFIRREGLLIRVSMFQRHCASASGEWSKEGMGEDAVEGELIPGDARHTSVIERVGNGTASGSSLREAKGDRVQGEMG